MSKIIHYCWFGPKPLPSLAKKCIKSWKKHLPDFEIKLWNESNFDINECLFIKQAYEQGKWPFVSDYVRTKVLYEYGGLYLDTDMEITKHIDHLLKNDLFIGREDSGFIAAGVLWVKDKENKYIKDILEFYQSQDRFDGENLFKIAIPKVITSCWDKYPVVRKENYDLIDENVYVYDKDFFYPINYDYSNKDFTKNTCMIHYYKADWVSRSEKITITIYRLFGKNIGRKIIKSFTFPKKVVGKIYRVFKNIINNNVYRIKRILDIFLNKNKRIKLTRENLGNFVNQKYIVIHNPDWLGISNSTKDLFKNCLPIRDIFNSDEIYKISKVICDSNIKTVLFSGLAKGYSDMIETIKVIDRDINIKVLWHGSNALLVENTDFNEFNRLLELYDSKYVDEIVFFKKSMY
ncbi:MAG: glycosyltransferase, partial [Clostridia bacterium]|nr:glycosyltransferase [Clostridia bacterium]